MLELSTPIQFVKGIGPRLAETLAAKGIRVIEDLLYYLPFRYEDRINPRTIAELAPGEMASVIAEVRTSMLLRTKRMPIMEMTAGQGRNTLKCMWFRGTYLKDRFQPGQLVALYGKVEQDPRGRGGLADASAAVRDPRRSRSRKRRLTMAARRAPSGVRWRWAASFPFMRARAG